MSDLIERLKQGRSVLGHVEINGIGIKMRLLTEADYFAITLDVKQGMAAQGVEAISVETADAWEAERMVQLAKRLLVDEAGKQVFADTKTLRETLTRADLVAIGDAYAEFEADFAPTERNTDEARMQEIVKELKKKPSAQAQNEILKSLNFAALRKLVLILVARPTS